MGDFYDFEGEEKTYGQERNVFDRITYRDIYSEFMSAPTIIDEKKRSREILSPEDQFLNNVRNFCREINEDEKLRLKISQKDNINLAEKSRLVTNIRYKNYVGYVLGYLASEQGKNIKKDTVLKIIKIFVPTDKDKDLSTVKNMVKSAGIIGEDIIRYARYWNLYLK